MEFRNASDRIEAISLHPSPLIWQLTNMSTKYMPKTFIKFVQNFHDVSQYKNKNVSPPAKHIMHMFGDKA